MDSWYIPTLYVCRQYDSVYMTGEYLTAPWEIVSIPLTPPTFPIDHHFCEF